MKEHTISQPFGFDNTDHQERKDFYNVFDKKHPGVDFPVTIGTEIYASFTGIVVRNEEHKGMGHVIGLRNGNIVALFAHLSDSHVQLGQIVDAGDLIGLSGDTGEACLTPHLHFELRDISKYILKEMVFEPRFDSEIIEFTDSFMYIVNNTNTKKTLDTLSVLYFGIPDYWHVIQENNQTLSTYRKDEVIQEGLSITIPNYKKEVL